MKYPSGGLTPPPGGEAWNVGGVSGQAVPVARGNRSGLVWSGPVWSGLAWPGLEYLGTVSMGFRGEMEAAVQPCPGPGMRSFSDGCSLGRDYDGAMPVKSRG